MNELQKELQKRAQEKVKETVSDTTGGRSKSAEGIGLSKRLQAVADMVTKGNLVCDVGCDHGFVSIYLVKSGISPGVIAMDVNDGPLQAARAHIEEYLLTDYIETRLSDGVREVARGEVQTLICAGMGGRLMKRILEEGADKIRTMEELILQPQSELQGMRRFLREQGYMIVDENMILEDGKFYPMMKVKVKQLPTEETENVAYVAETEEIQRIWDKYGPVLLAGRNPVLRSYLEREYNICREILDNLKNNGSRQYNREREIQNRKKDIETALSYFGQ